jgi:hypothetical protein
MRNERRETALAPAWRTPTIPVIPCRRNLRAMGMQYIRHGRGAVRPYIYAQLDTIKLIHEAFKATELERLETKNGFHIEARIGDSIIVLEAADLSVAGGTISSIHVYVTDVDQVFNLLNRGPRLSASRRTNRSRSVARAFGTPMATHGGLPPTPADPPAPPSGAPRLAKERSHA